MLFKYIAHQAGGHTHVKVFAGKGRDYTFAKCGDLVFLNDEWETFKRSLSNIHLIVEPNHDQEKEKS